MYAGAKFNNENHGVKEVWNANYTDWYFNLIKENKDRFLLEIGGHDHYEDVRVYYDSEI